MSFYHRKFSFGLTLTGDLVNYSCLTDFKIVKSSFGVVAQLGERMTGSHEVRGSIPLDSTNKIKGLGLNS